MKNLKLIIVIMLVISPILCGCSDDDDSYPIVMTNNGINYSMKEVDGFIGMPGIRKRLIFSANLKKGNEEWEFSITSPNDSLPRIGVPEEGSYLPLTKGYIYFSSDSERVYPSSVSGSVKVSKVKWKHSPEEVNVTLSFDNVVITGSKSNGGTDDCTIRINGDMWYYWSELIN